MVGSSGPQVLVFGDRPGRRVVDELVAIGVEQVVRADVRVEGHRVVGALGDGRRVGAQADLRAQVLEHELHRQASTLDVVHAVLDARRLRDGRVEQPEDGHQYDHAHGHRGHELDQRVAGLLAQGRSADADRAHGHSPLDALPGILIVVEAEPVGLVALTAMVADFRGFPVLSLAHTE